MVKDVTKLHKCHLGVGICLNMCVVCAGFTQDFEFRKGGGGGRGMMVKDVTKLHKCHLEVRICLNVCVVCAGFTQDFEFRKGGNSKVQC